MENVIFGIMGIGVLWMLFNIWKNHRRRQTLHQDSAGMYVWVEFGGRECSSHIHPDEPGGAWYSDASDSHSDSGGDGGGGD